MGIKMSGINDRELVLNMLLSVERQEDYSHRIVKDILAKYDYLSGQEKAFIKRLFEGTVERGIQLDYYLNQVSNTPAKKMKPLIRCLLRMSAYQILFMDAVPDAAAVNEAVRLVEKRKFYNLKGFVNGVLRGLSQKKDVLSLPSPTREPLQFLSVCYSVPEWLAQHFLDSYGCETARTILEGLLLVRPVTIRFARRAARQEALLLEQFAKRGVRADRHPYAENIYYLENCENIAALPGFSEGLFTVQDTSSMLAVAAAGIREGDRVLDVCAAPGGKSVLAAEYAGESGSVEARDVSAYKVSLIEENAERMKCTNVHAAVWDATVPDAESCESADVVLADVPCTGLGVIGKKRDIKYRQSRENLTEITALQKEIVRQAVRYVKPGGTLLYSTCTINRAENEDMVRWMQEELSLQPETVAPVLLQFPHTETADAGYIQLLPGVHDTDGFFFAKLKRGLS